ncbi:hypothetical protein E0H26_21200 [Micromonospora zingiberis]|uniref:Uncharacterized protein n=1 Tax=Micromonospora zingiberis TaxID=2053011 RepID=A0A4R0GE53_9ACTN|nr:hypothetical protein [Micromonospora zingiberis]TCB94442.1 hypothetical protein E0H26_21200 [Micromonospora zingiberis]
MENRLERENRLVLDVVQAALGLISRVMRAISVDLDSNRIILHVAVHEHSAQVDEDIEDLVFELEALQDGSIAIESIIFVGAPSAGWPGNTGRRVYVAKEPENRGGEKG